MNFLMYCYGLNISPPTPQNTYVKITPKVMVLGGGAFGKCLGHEGRYLIYKRGPKICAGDTRNMGSIPGSKKSPGERNGNPVFLPGKFHGQGSLVGCSPWSHEELGTTEQLSACAYTHTHTHAHTHKRSRTVPLSPSSLWGYTKKSVIQKRAVAMFVLWSQTYSL